VEIRKSAGEDIKTPHIKWARRFLGRHQDIVLRKGTPMEKDRRMGGSLQVVTDHFNKFENVVHRGGYLSALTYNFDEKPLINKTDKKPKLLADPKSTFEATKKDNIIVPCTAAPCIAADGGHETTAVLYPAEWNLNSLKKSLHNSKGFAHYNAPNGQMTKNCMEDHMINRLFPDLCARREEMEKFIESCDEETRAKMFHSAQYHVERAECDACNKSLHITGFRFFGLICLIIFLSFFKMRSTFVILAKTCACVRSAIVRRKFLKVASTKIRTRWCLLNHGRMLCMVDVTLFIILPFSFFLLSLFSRV
jgi:hypothetical protein